MRFEYTAIRGGLHLGKTRIFAETQRLALFPARKKTRFRR